MCVGIPLELSGSCIAEQRCCGCATHTVAFGLEIWPKFKSTQIFHLGMLDSFEVRKRQEWRGREEVDEGKEKGWGNMSRGGRRGEKKVGGRNNDENKK